MRWLMVLSLVMTLLLPWPLRVEGAGGFGAAAPFGSRIAAAKPL